MGGCIGTLYGVGVGPGDPELITVKAKRILEKCRVLAVPVTHRGNALALDIARGVTDLSGKELLELPFPMTDDRTTLGRNYEAQAARVAQALESGEDVAFVCLGDVSVFSTFSSVGEILMNKGYPVEMVPGVTSFCAAACALKISLTAMDEPLHILPAGFADIENALALPGVKVLMKSAGRFPAVRRAVSASGRLACAAINCGLEGERLYRDIADMPEDPGYFTTIIVKERP
ncbi:MAG: precorrin-2 C(20)-methyltransferase [Bacillota bacterium]